VLTRADSEAIAASVARQMNRKRAAPAAGLSQQNLDSIRNEVERSVTDSVMRMLAAAPPRSPGIPPVRSLSGAGFGAPVRVVLAEVADRSADKSLGRLAGALTDSLRRLLQRRPQTALLPRREVGMALQRSGDLRALGQELGADYVVRGFVEGAGGDSVQVVFELLDSHDPRYAKSLRHTSLRADAASLPGMVTPMIASWLDRRQEANGAGSRFGIPSQAQRESLLQQSRRLRDSLRRRPPNTP
jgi:TolB-like protein